MRTLDATEIAYRNGREKGIEIGKELIIKKVLASLGDFYDTQCPNCRGGIFPFDNYCPFCGEKIERDTSM